ELREHPVTLQSLENSQTKRRRSNAATGKRETRWVDDVCRAALASPRAVPSQCHSPCKDCRSLRRQDLRCDITLAPPGSFRRPERHLRPEVQVQVVPERRNGGR